MRTIFTTFLIILFVQIGIFPNIQAETLGEKIANSEKIYFLKMKPSKILVQLQNYNQSPVQFEPTFFDDKVKLFDILTFKSAFTEMKFVYEKEITQEMADEFNAQVLEYLTTYINKDKIIAISPEKFKDEYAINSIYIQPEMPNYVFVEHTNDDNFHYVTMNSFKADFGINIYEVPLAKKKKKIISSSGSAPVYKKSFGINGAADNVQKAQATNQIIDDYFGKLQEDFTWHLSRFIKDFEKNLGK